MFFVALAFLALLLFGVGFYIVRSARRYPAPDIDPDSPRHYGNGTHL